MNYLVIRPQGFLKQKTTSFNPIHIIVTEPKVVKFTNEKQNRKNNILTGSLKTSLITKTSTITTKHEDNLNFTTSLQKLPES